MIYRKCLLIVLACLALSSCGNSTPWQGWVYPDKDDLTDYIPMGSFSSLEECRISAKHAIRILSEAEQRTQDSDASYEPLAQDYECGYKCRPDAGGLNVCESTER